MEETRHDSKSLDTGAPDIMQRIVNKLAEHLHEHQTQATHIMLPPADAEELERWIREKNVPVLQQSQAVTAVGRRVAGVQPVRGPEFKAWRATDPVYVGRFSRVMRCRQASPEELTALGQPDAVASLGQFIISAGQLWPGFPIYRAWFVSVISLADIPGVPPAKKTAPDMTHEIMVTAADPNVDYDPDPERPETWHPFAGKVAHQFKATDAVALRVAEQCAKGATDGLLPLVDVGDDGRAAWGRAIDQTVEHLMTGGHGVKPS